ncbi:hypothetical protein I7I51_02794 [Histoplasma capsulatum]|uniref:Uncharacterized protein n=1 Tax=Ajellomyces capsulatus TaxID=5037 RepID=A0A8A1ML92_AJECA|nr:hypothetical protein I7I51_02794 [Histoplasma capsulatum]
MAVDKRCVRCVPEINVASTGFRITCPGMSFKRDENGNPFALRGLNQSPEGNEHFSTAPIIITIINQQKAYPKIQGTRHIRFKSVPRYLPKYTSAAEAYMCVIDVM